MNKQWRYIDEESCPQCGLKGQTHVDDEGCGYVDFENT